MIIIGIIQVSCAHLNRIYFTPETRLPENIIVLCPQDSTTWRIAAQTDLDLKFITDVVKVVLDRKVNFSSADLEWNPSKQELGKLNKDGILMVTKYAHGYVVLDKGIKSYF